MCFLDYYFDLQICSTFFPLFISINSNNKLFLHCLFHFFYFFSNPFYFLSYFFLYVIVFLLGVLLVFFVAICSLFILLYSLLIILIFTFIFKVIFYFSTASFLNSITYLLKIFPPVLDSIFAFVFKFLLKVIYLYPQIIVYVYLILLRILNCHFALFYGSFLRENFYQWLALKFCFLIFYNRSIQISVSFVHSHNIVVLYNILI